MEGIGEADGISHVTASVALIGSIKIILRHNSDSNRHCKL